jgi:hypothetical protein
MRFAETSLAVYNGFTKIRKVLEEFSKNQRQKGVQPLIQFLAEVEEILLANNLL